jgi:hypothetical protein
LPRGLRSAYGESLNALHKPEGKMNGHNGNKTLSADGKSVMISNNPWL